MSQARVRASSGQKLQRLVRPADKGFSLPIVMSDPSSIGTNISALMPHNWASVMVTNNMYEVTSAIDTTVGQAVRMFRLPL